MSFMFEDKLYKRKLKVRKPSLNGIPHLFFCFVEHGTKLSHEPEYNIDTPHAKDRGFLVR